MNPPKVGMSHSSSHFQVLIVAVLLTVSCTVLWYLKPVTEPDPDIPSQNFEDLSFVNSLAYTLLHDWTNKQLVIPKSKAISKYEPVQLTGEARNQSEQETDLAQFMCKDSPIFLAPAGARTGSSKTLHRVAFVAHNVLSLRALAPLAREIEFAVDSPYLSAFILAPELHHLSVEDIEQILHFSTSSNTFKFGCRMFHINQISPEAFKAVTRKATIFIFFGVKDLQGSKQVEVALEDINSKYQIPSILIPAPDMSSVKWLARSPPESLLNWNVPDFTISVTTVNHPASLQRLLNSLKAACYLGDQVTLIINSESFSDAHTLQIMHAFEWPHGPKVLKHRVKKGGVISSVMESWYPNSFDEYGVLLEDSVEVSKYFYVWCRYNLMAYRYGNPDNYKAGLLGFSLYTPRKNELVEGMDDRVWWDSNAFFKDNVGDPYTPFIQPLVCSWGALMFPKIWMEFHLFATLRMQEEIHVAIEVSKVNRRSTSWEKYFNEMSHLLGYFMIYPNFKNQISFSTNHLAVGVHIENDDDDISEHSNLPLADNFNELLEQLPDGKLPDIEKLPAMSILGQYENSSNYFLSTHSENDTTLAAKAYNTYLKCVHHSKRGKITKEVLRSCTSLIRRVMEQKLFNLHQ